MCIAIVCEPGCDVMDFKIKLILNLKGFELSKIVSDLRVRL